MPLDVHTTSSTVAKENVLKKFLVDKGCIRGETVESGWTVTLKCMCNQSLICEKKCQVCFSVSLYKKSVQEPSSEYYCIHTLKTTDQGHFELPLAPSLYSSKFGFFDNLHSLSWTLELTPTGDNNTIEDVQSVVFPVYVPAIGIPIECVSRHVTESWLDRALEVSLTVNSVVLASDYLDVQVNIQNKSECDVSQARISIRQKGSFSHNELNQGWNELLHMQALPSVSSGASPEDKLVFYIPKTAATSAEVEIEDIKLKVEYTLALEVMLDEKRYKLETSFHVNPSEDRMDMQTWEQIGSLENIEIRGEENGYKQLRLNGQVVHDSTSTEQKFYFTVTEQDFPEPVQGQTSHLFYHTQEPRWDAPGLVITCTLPIILKVTLEQTSSPVSSTSDESNISICHTTTADGLTHTYTCVVETSGTYLVTLSPLQPLSATRFAITPSIVPGLSQKLLNNPDAFWKPLSLREVPSNAFVVGRDVQNEPLYAIRALIAGGLHVGKYGPHLKCPLVSYGGKEVSLGDSSDHFVEILTLGSGFRWVHVVSGIPHNAIQAGYEVDGKPLYLGRSEIVESMGGLKLSSSQWLGKMVQSLGVSNQSTVIPGKYGQHLSGLSVGFAGREVVGQFPFELLVWEEPLSYENSEKSK